MYLGSPLPRVCLGYQICMPNYCWFGQNHNSQSIINIFSIHQSFYIFDDMSKFIILIAALFNLSSAFNMVSMRRSSMICMNLNGGQDARSTADIMRNNMNKMANVGSKALMGAAVIAGSTALPALARTSNKVWEKVELPVRETLFDISFDPQKPEHGWLVGAKGTFLETFDEGKTWNTRTFSSLDEDEDINYRFEVASLLDNEGWIIGKPAIMLHTRDGGKQFERIPLSPKLPGEPVSIKATGSGKAEMITSQGAVYQTVNGGLNWKAQVKETIDATLNRVSSSGTSGASFFSGKISNEIRDVNGNYIAIATRGNLFLTWTPGQDYWVPHNRGSSRRYAVCNTPHSQPPLTHSFIHSYPINSNSLSSSTSNPQSIEFKTWGSLATTSRMVSG